MLVGADQDVPSKLTTFPWESTAAQNDADEQDTDTKPPLASTVVGADHDVPLNVTTSPALSTPAQNDAEGQLTPTKPPLLGSMLAGELHVIVGVEAAVIWRVAVVAAAALEVGVTLRRKYQTPSLGAAYFAVYAPAAVVDPVVTVVQVVEDEGRRCTLTVRVTCPVPVLTVTASATVAPTTVVVGVVDHPDTVVVAPAIPVTFRELVVLDAAFAVAGTYKRK